MPPTGPGWSRSAKAAGGRPAAEERSALGGPVAAIEERLGVDQESQRMRGRAV